MGKEDKSGGWPFGTVMFVWLLLFFLPGRANEFCGGNG